MESVHGGEDVVQEKQKENTTMKIRLSQLRQIIRETIEELAPMNHVKQCDELTEDEFVYALASAAAKGEKTTNIAGKKFPVTMSKKRAEDIVDEQK